MVESAFLWCSLGNAPNLANYTSPGNQEGPTGPNSTEMGQINSKQPSEQPMEVQTTAHTVLFEVPDVQGQVHCPAVLTSVR